MSDNPFGVQNPEHVDPQYIAENFVEVLTDVPRLKEPSNTFLHGARGTGKSMLLRSLEPRVMMLRGDGAKTLKDLPFLAVHVPLKMADFGAPEINRYKGYAATSIGEHLLIMHVMLRIAQLLESYSEEISEASADIFLARFEDLFGISGGGAVASDRPGAVGKGQQFRRIARTCEVDIVAVRQFFVRAPFKQGEVDYDGALTGFLDFLVPLAEEVGRMDELPTVPLFVMLDDADNLPIPMQRVLNSWVSTRSTRSICLKVTTQLAYATLRTIDNRIIESPHDYSEVNLTQVYTASFDDYSRRVREIVAKRLKNCKIETPVEQFFPEDAAQAARLKEIAAEIAAEHALREQDGARDGAARARDETRRYTVPTFMRELAGSSKSAHTFSYAGFRSLVDLSSGVVRWFLEPASAMYDRMVSQGNGKVTSIPVGVQDTVIREWSAEFLELLTRKSEQATEASDTIDTSEASLHAVGHETVFYEQLRNLIDGLGRVFRGRLLNEKASEQRVFSIVLRDRPKRELEDVLNMGVRMGYLQRSDNAAKEALGGRRPRFIMARRLGPYYKLDVSGYAAHLSVMAGELEIAMKDPGEFVKRRLKIEQGETSQFSLDLDGGHVENSHI
ncbi:hypothetical protein [Mesorhizobium erdmanii]|uniref:ORC-CDC6 family AAA ATPase n=1 Tax=Mesorhizobium erdmanii TaxID=1777866 RepID=UPI0003F77D4C|nr:hypothetical protein [Mesorhizobium erdmanii]